MRNPEQTKIKIIQHASTLFNKQGYKATSLSDITASTGLTKGAIYKHFLDKADLEQQCLIYMTNNLLHSLEVSIRRCGDATSKLNAIFDFFSQYATRPPFVGGCPVMNTAIEVDDGDQVMKTIVGNTLDKMFDSLIHIINNGLKHGQLDSCIDPHQYASVIFSSLEGGIMLMKITDDNTKLMAVVDFLKKDLIEKAK